MDRDAPRLYPLLASSFNRRFTREIWVAKLHRGGSRSEDRRTRARSTSATPRSRPGALVSNEILNLHVGVVLVVPITSAAAGKVYPHEVRLPAGSLRRWTHSLNEFRALFFAAS